MIGVTRLEVSSTQGTVLDRVLLAKFSTKVLATLLTVSRVAVATISLPVLHIYDGLASILAISVLNCACARAAIGGTTQQAEKDLRSLGIPTLYDVAALRLICHTHSSQMNTCLREMALYNSFRFIPEVRVQMLSDFYDSRLEV